MPRKSKNSNDNDRLLALEASVAVLRAKAERFHMIVDSDEDADSVIERKIAKLEASMSIMTTAMYILYGALITACFAIVFKIF
jgi:hypothetical protein